MIDPANRGAVGALNYQLPQIQPVQSQQQAPYNDGIEALQGIQDANGQANEYYRKVAALKSFMQDVNSNYGIDVRVPDLSRPESIKLNEIYRTALADIMAQGNLLKNSAHQWDVNQQMGMVYRPGVNPTATPVANLVPNQDYWSRNFEPAITEINNKLQMPSQTEEEHNQKLEIYKNAIAHLDQLSTEHPERRDYYEYQKRGLTAPTKGDWRPYQDRLPWQMYSGNAKKEASGNFVKDIVNLQHGTSSSYSLDTQTLDPTSGDPLYVSKSYQDDLKGKDENGRPQVIDKWGYNPKTGQSYIFFKNGQVKEITKDNALSIARSVLGANSDRYGIDAEYIDQWANGKLDKFGQLNYTQFLPEDVMKIHQDRQEAQAKTVTKAQQENLGAELENFNQNEKTYMLLPDPSRTYTTRQGQELTIRRDGKDKLNISPDSFALIVAKPSDKTKQAAYQKAYNEYVKEGTTPARLKAFLIKFGVHETLNKQNSGTIPAQPSKPDSTGVVNKGGKKLAGS